MDPETKLFGTKRQLEDYTGYSGFISAFLWRGLKRGTIEDQDIVEAVALEPGTDINLCMIATKDRRVENEVLLK